MGENVTGGIRQAWRGPVRVLMHCRVAVSVLRYLYIYIERESERERQKGGECGCSEAYKLCVCFPLAAGECRWRWFTSAVKCRRRTAAPGPAPVITSISSCLLRQLHSAAGESDFVHTSEWSSGNCFQSLLRAGD